MTTCAKPASMVGLVKAKPKDGAGTPPALPVAADDPLVVLNFTVPRSFRRQFKWLALDL